MRRASTLLSLSFIILCVIASSALAVPQMGSGWYWPTDQGDDVIFGWLQWNSYFSGYHLGLDFRNSAGQAVYSIGDGEVISSGEHNGYGNNGYGTGGCVLARYQAADGTWFTAMYGHLDNYIGTGGVSAGQIVGYSLPDWSPPHLHFSTHPGYDPRSSSDGKGPWRGYTPSSGDTMGFAEPRSFLNAHPRTPPCSPADVWWNSPPTQNVWYNTDFTLSYGTSGSDLIVTSSALNISSGGLGDKDLWVRCRNGCGDKTIHWYGKWDNVRPVTNFSGPATSTWLPAGSSVAWNPTDGTSGISSSSFGWDNGSTNGQVPEGVHNVTVSANDTAGNSVTETHGPYWLDTIAPVPSLSGPATSTWLNTPQSVTWNAADATSGVSTKLLTWDNGSTATASPASIPEGKRTATITATDVARNAATPYVAGPFWIDTYAPIVILTLNPATPNGENGWYTVDPTVSVSAADPNGADGSGVDDLFYSIDGSEQPFATEVTIAGDGVHACTGRATDVAGNSGASPVEVKVDTTAPVFTGIHTEPESGVLDTLSASWACDDEHSGVAEYEYSIYREAGETDELVLGPVITSEPYAQETGLALTRGETYYFLVRAKNNAGLYTSLVASDGILANEGTRDAAPGFNSGGVSVDAEARTSTNYMLVDSLGQFVVDASTSTRFVLESGYWHSEVPTTPVETVAIAKATDNNKLIQLGSPDKPVVVTVAPGIFTDRFYVEQPNRSSGIAVSFGSGLTSSLAAGDRVWILGTLNETSGERMIQYAAPTFIFHSDPLEALFVSNGWLGGSDLNSLTKGIDGATGLNNIGLLIKTCGRVGNIDPAGAYFYISDGSSRADGTTTDGEANIGVRVAADGRSYTDQFVTVTGISSCFIADDGKQKRLIRPIGVENPY